MNTASPAEDVGKYLRRLADELTAAGVLCDPAWRRAWETVPRHMFVPRFAISSLGQSSADSAKWYDSADPGQRSRWLEAAYRNEALITSYAANGAAISSSTEPSLMARMLDMLDLHDGQKVLEIGTGTGYNAALLAHRLGSDHVTSIDIDAALTRTAVVNLNSAGYPVTVLTGNGAYGAPERAPFDRIIATCGVDRIPISWIDQLAPEGAILVNVSRGLILLRSIGDNTVSGRFCDQAGFMVLRTENESPTPMSSEVFNVTGVAAQCQRDVDVPPHLDFIVVSFLASLIAERSYLLFVHTEDRTAVGYRWWHPDSDSWVRVELRDGGLARIHETGTRRLWAELTPILAGWDNAGRPDLDHFGLTVTPQQHTLWINSPSSPHQWDLPS